MTPWWRDPALMVPLTGLVCVLLIMGAIVWHYFFTVNADGCRPGYVDIGQGICIEGYHREP